MGQVLTATVHCELRKDSSSEATTNTGMGSAKALGETEKSWKSEVHREPSCPQPQAELGGECRRWKGHLYLWDQGLVDVPGMVLDISLMAQYLEMI